MRFVTQEKDPYWDWHIDLIDQGPHCEASASKAAQSGADADESCGSRYGMRVELSVSYLHRTEMLKAALAAMPSFMSETWLATVYQSFWTF